MTQNLTEWPRSKPLTCFLEDINMEELNCSLGQLRDPCRNSCQHGWSDYPIRQQMGNEFAAFLYAYIWPVLVALTVISTVFVTYILSRPHMRTPTNRVLLYMAIADVLVALVPLPFVFIFVLLGNYKNLRLMQSSWCYLALFSTDALPPFCHNMAIWLTVLLAVQRLIYILCPMKARSICTVKNVNIASVAIMIFSLIFAFPKFVDISEMDVLRYKIVNKTSNQVVEDKVTCIMKYNEFVEAKIGLNVYFGFYYWSRVILFVLIPSLILVIVTMLLVRGLRKAKRRKQRLIEQRRTRDAHRQGESSSTTAMLILVVTIFLLVNLPQGTLLAFICVRQVVGPTELDPKLLNRVTTVDNLLILATYPINFAIYCSMSAQFRQTFKRMFVRTNEPMLRPYPSQHSRRRGSEPISYYHTNGQIEVSNHYKLLASTAV